MLKVLEPVPPEPSGPASGTELAPRLDSLAGRTIAFIDAWGHRAGDVNHMYPLFASLKRRLESEHGVAESLWFPKESVSKGLSPAALEEVVARAEAVIVGEAI